MILMCGSLGTETIHFVYICEVSGLGGLFQKATEQTGYLVFVNGKNVT